MRRKTMALILALSMCLSLLSACGSGNTATDDKPPESENATSSTEQPEESEKPEESGEPKEEEPGESEEPTQKEPKEEHAGTKLLALLQEEYQNGFVEGDGPRHTYLQKSNDVNAFIHNGVVYIWDAGGWRDDSWFSYDITSKECREISAFKDIEDKYGYFGYLDGNFYFNTDTIDTTDPANDFRYIGRTTMYDCNGALLNSSEIETNIRQHCYCFFEKGILADGTVLLSHNLEKIADIPVPQREIEHGLKKDVEFKLYIYVAAADGTVYAMGTDEHWYRLNLDTYEWEDAGEALISGNNFAPFWGKYVVARDRIYNRVTGEEVFNWDEVGVYRPVSGTKYRDDYLCYFGGDKYLGFDDNSKEYRWVNLKDLTMSAPLPFPEGPSSEEMTILNDTYCVYYDKYGWFLWNYNTGEEETIMMFEQ